MQQNMGEAVFGPDDDDRPSGERFREAGRDEETVGNVTWCEESDNTKHFFGLSRSRSKGRSKLSPSFGSSMPKPDRVMMLRMYPLEIATQPIDLSKPTSKKDYTSIEPRGVY